MASEKRPYESPVIRVETFAIGVYGDYGATDTENYAPVIRDDRFSGFLRTD